MGLDLEVLFSASLFCFFNSTCLESEAQIGYAPIRREMCFRSGPRQADQQREEQRARASGARLGSTGTLHYLLFAIPTSHLAGNRCDLGHATSAAASQ
jgi:hypothetical protein